MAAISLNTCDAQPCAVLEIEVRQHGGVLAQVVGLLARRAYRVQGLVCRTLADGRHGRIWLQVHEDLRLPQVLRQVAKLEDVLAVRQHPAGHAVFGRVAEFFEPAGA